MAHQHRINKHRKQSSRSSRPAAVERLAIPERKPPTIYGKPFIILEDGQKNAFNYDSGA